jgi:subtilase family serine protease
MRLPALATFLSVFLAACGSGDPGPAPNATPLALSSSTIDIPADVPPVDAAAILAQPTFHVAPLLLDAPDDSDADGSSASSARAPHVQAVPPALATMNTRRLTVQDLVAAQRRLALDLRNTEPETNAAPLATASTVTTYTPAQIRAAYGLPALPAAGTAVTATQAAQLGAGQTIYIIDAQHDPNVAAELAVFNQKFGLPTCTSRTIAAGTTLPLTTAAPADGCVLALAYSNASGALSNMAPAYDSGWATEITLDVQWAHATAPLARIVLIEAPDSSTNSLVGAIRLANAMGPGVVSMSFGANEGSWTSTVDSAFTGTGMSYLAATGDSGSAVSWPSVSANVLAVGGTSLAYSGSGARSESGWSGTGGGISAYVPTPAYQASKVPGVGSLPRRGVADVAFNADPATGQFVAVIPAGSSATSWISAGGTSLSTPQWAGLVAVANAIRAQTGKTALGAPHSTLYGQIGAVPTSYAAAFADIVTGSDGSCATCSARSGYDQLTGLGTPNAATLLTALAGSTIAPAAPVVTAATASGKVGTAFSYAVTVTAANPVSYALAGAPTGMTISTAGVLAWPTPVQGSYAVTVSAKDSKTAAVGQGVVTVKIDPAIAPVVTAATISGTAGKALSYTVAVSASNAVSFTLSSAPAGMSISSAGVLGWPAPVAGQYKVTVLAKDSKTGLIGQAVMTVTIAASSVGPVIQASPITGVAGKAISGAITVTDPGGYSMSVTLSGVPLGVGLALSGSTIQLSWPNPVTGTYSINVSVKDSAGRTAQAVVPITVSAK